MDKPIVRKTTSSALSADAPVNIDGKGANGLMLDWYRTEPRGLVVKSQHQVLAEFFTSMFVLAASFKYKPAVGILNYLYLVDNNWNLSLVAPEQWTNERQAGFAGTCVLQPDMTWTIEPSEQLLEQGPLSAAVARFFDAFADVLDTDATLEEILPFYVRQMPYWQRLHANALARSIRGTVALGGQSEIRARNWCLALPAVRDAFLLGRTGTTERV